MSKPNFKQNEEANQPTGAGASRLDAIYARLENLRSLKDEIMGGLEEFMDDVETKSVQKAIEFPQQFDEVVDVVVGDARAKASEKAIRQEEKEEASAQRALEYRDSGEATEPEAKISYEGVLENMGLVENEEKPFWAKFLRSDYLQDDAGPLLPDVMEVLEGNKQLDEVIPTADAGSRALALYTEDEYDSAQQTPRSDGLGAQAEDDGEAQAKMQREWAKICRLEQRLGVANKA